MSDVIKICVFGPESTGKSTLVEKLAMHYGCPFVPEYAKELIAAQSGALTLADIPRIAQGQMESEEEALMQADKLLICDSDLLTTMIWSNWLFGECPDWVMRQAYARHYDLYLLADIDVPWVDDVHRYLPTDRANFMAACIATLDSKPANYVKISGDWQERFVKACHAIDKLLAQQPEPNRQGATHDIG